MTKIKVATFAAAVFGATGAMMGFGLSATAVPASHADVCIGWVRFPDQNNVSFQCNGCVSWNLTNQILDDNGMRPMSHDDWWDFRLDRHHRHTIDMSQYC